MRATGFHAAGWRCRRGFPQAGSRGRDSRFETKASRGSSRFVTAAMTKPGRQIHRHVLHRMHRDVRFAVIRAPSSSSFTNKPLPPILASEVSSMRSPCVVMPSRLVVDAGIERLQTPFDVLRLPQCERAFAGGDNDAGRRDFWAVRHGFGSRGCELGPPSHGNPEPLARLGLPPPVTLLCAAPEAAMPNQSAHQAELLLQQAAQHPGSLLVHLHALRQKVHGRLVAGRSPRQEKPCARSA